MILQNICSIILKMYSFSETGIHYLQQPENGEPQVKIICRCSRVTLQEEVFTCLACQEYCCHYCTSP